MRKGDPAGRGALSAAATALCLVLVATACQLRQESGGVIVPAVEYQYLAKLTNLPAGRMPFRLRNEGKEPHELVLAKLDPGKNLGDLRGVRDLSTVVAGRPTTAKAAAGAETSIDVDLTSGIWLMVCLLYGPGGKSHADLGMAQTFNVQ